MIVRLPIDELSIERAVFSLQQIAEAWLLKLKAILGWLYMK